MLSATELQINKLTSNENSTQLVLLNSQSKHYPSEENDSRLETSATIISQKEIAPINLGKMLCFRAGKMIHWFCGKETAARALEGRRLVSVDNLHLQDIPKDVVDADISPLQQYIYRKECMETPITERYSYMYMLFSPALNCHDNMFSPLQFHAKHNEWTFCACTLITAQ